MPSNTGHEHNNNCNSKRSTNRVQIDLYPRNNTPWVTRSTTKTMQTDMGGGTQMFRATSGINAVGAGSGVGRIEASDLFFRGQLCGGTLIARPKKGPLPTLQPKRNSKGTSNIRSNSEGNSAKTNSKTRTSAFSRLPFHLGRNKEKLKKQETLQGAKSPSTNALKKLQTKSSVPTSPDLPISLSAENLKKGYDITTLQRSSARKVKNLMARVSKVCQVERERQKNEMKAIEQSSSAGSPLVDDVLFSTKSEATTTTAPCSYDDSVSTVATGRGVGPGGDVSSASAAPEDDLETLANWAKDAYYVVVMTKNKAIPLAVSAMIAFPYNSNFLVSCCTLLTRLCADSSANQATAVKSGAISQLITMMSVHAQTTRVQAGACETLRALTTDVISSALSSSKSGYLLLLQLIEILERDVSPNGVFHQSQRRRDIASELLTQLKLGRDDEKQ